MKIDIITLFPEIALAPLNESIIARARKNKIANVQAHNLRHWASGKPHGEGTAVDAKTGNRWEGQWKEGRRHGEGTVYWGNGNEREGTWREGVAMAGEWRIR